MRLLRNSVHGICDEFHKRFNYFHLVLICLIGVYFKVTFSQTTTSAPPGNIIWESVFENVGNGYNESTGIFTTPRSGIYQFSITVMNPAPSSNSHVYLSLRTGDSGICNAVAAEDHFQTGVCSRVIRLQAGQGVWVVNPSGGPYQYHGNDYTAFSAVLLHAEI